MKEMFGGRGAGDRATRLEGQGARWQAGVAGSIAPPHAAARVLAEERSARVVRWSTEPVSSGHHWLLVTDYLG